MLADQIRDEMQKRGLTQSMAAEELGVPQSILNRWLSGQHVPSAQHCPRVAAFLGISREEVMRMAGHWEDEPDDEAKGQRRDPEWEVLSRELRAIFTSIDRTRWRPVKNALRQMVSAITVNSHDNHLFPHLVIAW
jgi:transcriptional regulator with XRE-family HTH domain